MSREECTGSTILALKLGGSTAPSSRPLRLARVPSARDKISCRQVCKVIIDGGNFTNTISSDVVHAKTVSKLWTALFGGKEDDEPMAPQVNITASVELLGNNIKCPSFIKLGGFSFDAWKNMMKEWKLPCTPVKSTKLFFLGINLLKKLDEKQERKPSTIQFGSMRPMEIT